MYTHIKSGKSYTDKQTKDYFDKLRRSDDEFARDYARHEFGKWVKERYVYSSEAESKSKFELFASKYNQLRHEMMKAYQELCEEKKLKPEYIAEKTADEILGIIMDIEMATEKL